MNPARRGNIGRAAAYLVPLLLTLALFLPFALKGEYKVDTALYAGLSWHMVQEGTGGWLTPMAGDLPYFNKPPLALWLNAAAMSVVGKSLDAILLFQMLVACAVVAATVALWSRLAGRFVGMLTGIQLASTAAFVGNADRLILDFWLLLFIVLAVWAAAPPRERRTLNQTVGQTSRLSAGPQDGHPFLSAASSGLFLGCALMVKPMLALVVPPMLAVWLLLIGERRRAVGALFGALIAVAVAAPWHAYMVHLHGDAFTSQYFEREIVQRTASERFDADPWYHVFRDLVRTGIPWSLAVPFAAWHALQRRLPRFVAAARGVRTNAHVRAMALVAVWTLAWLALLLASADKRFRYLMPIWPVLLGLNSLFLASIGAQSWAWLRAQRLRATAGALLAASVLASAVILAVRKPDEPEWNALYAFLRDTRAREPDTPIYNLSLWFHYGGRLYLNTDVWPLATRNWSDEQFRSPTPGSLAITRPEHNALPATADEIVFEQGRLRVVRIAGRDAVESRPAAELSPANNTAKP